MADLYKIIEGLLKEKGVSGAQMSRDLGMSRSFMTELRKGRAKSVKTETAQRLADYFNVSVDYLLGNVSDPFFSVDNASTLADINDTSAYEKTPTLTKKDERDIAKSLESIMADLEHSGDLMFDGDPMTEEARQSMRNAIELGLKAAKLLNKETYNPNKNKKG